VTRSLLALPLLCALAAPAAAQRFSTMLGAEAWKSDTAPVHGALLLAYDSPELFKHGRAAVEFNTDTLRVFWTGMRLGDLQLETMLGGEAILAGLLPDYYQDGARLPEQGFNAGWVQFAQRAKGRIAPDTFMELELGGRRWFFSANDDTAADFVLPAQAWVFEPRLRYTWWRLQGDAAWSDRHRVFPRHQGIAIGGELGADVRSSARPWGALGNTRNAADEVVLVASQWLRAGWQLHPRVRTEFVETASLGAGQDDLTRARLGGLNPYVVPIAGAPWASWLSETYVSGLWSWHFKALEDLELGPLATATYLVDRGRTGASGEADVILGVGGLVDWRHGPWQVDLRGGWSPTVADLSDQASFSTWLSVGWAMDFEGKQ
jgi:hypothetical protein